MVHVLDYLPNICHVWNHFYNPEIKNSKSSLFFLHTPLCWQGSGTFSGLVGHGKRIRVVRGLLWQSAPGPSHVQNWDEFREVIAVQIKVSGRFMCFTENAKYMGGVMVANFLWALLEISIWYKFWSVKGERSDYNFFLMVTLWRELGWVLAHTFNQLPVLKHCSSSNLRRKTESIVMIHSISLLFLIYSHFRTSQDLLSFRLSEHRCIRTHAPSRPSPPLGVDI